MSKENPTLGEIRMRVSFNPSNNPQVDTVKQVCAEAIDFLQSIRNDEVSKTYDSSQEQLKALSGERLRLIERAQTAFEDAGMLAVKAIT